MSVNWIQIFVQSQNKNIPIIINKAKSIKYLYQNVKEKLNISTNIRIVLVCQGDILDEESSETIESKCIQWYSTLDFFVPMDSSQPDEFHETEETRQLLETISHSSINLSAGIKFLFNGECCICLDDTPGVQRIKMSCGCVIGVDDDCMKNYFHDLVKNGKFSFTCPGCESIWQHSLVRQVLSATLTSEELKSFTEKVTSNFALGCPTIQSCPKCDNYLTHDPQKAEGFRNKYWVRCPICTRNEGKLVEFCWVCLNPWKGDKLSCGNDICTGKDPRIQKLETCGTKSIDNVHTVPIIRACVNCGALIEHTDKCKHMACKFCKCEFCFVCLMPRKKETGKWQCGSYDAVCEVAPRQTSLFLM